MSTHILLLELRMMARERAAWLLLALFAGALSYGYWNGYQLAKRNSEAAETALHGSEELQRNIRKHLSGPGKAIPVGGRRGIAMVGFLAQLPPAPLPVLATGQSDLVPASETVTLMRLTTPVSTRSEIENPSHLLAGRFDLAFVLIWLYPLFLLAFLYDLMAGDRETGTLRLALSQGISPAGWLSRRTLARALPVVVIALAATLLAGSDGYGLRLGAALAVILLYGLFWATLAAAINAVSNSAAGAATSLGAAWVAIVLVAPTLLNLAAESLYPTPSRPELVAASRQASGEAEKLGDQLLDSFYKEHPELAPPDKRADYVAMKLTEQEEVARSVAPVLEKFDKQLLRQQQTVGRWRFVSPAIVAHEALTDIAGTGYWRHRAFRGQVKEFKHAISDFYTPKAHRREPLVLADIDKMPQFTFQEEHRSDWLARVSTGLGGMLAFSAVIGCWALLSLRPRRLGAAIG